MFGKLKKSDISRIIKNGKEEENGKTMGSSE